MTTGTQIFFAVASLVIAITGLFFAWVRWRASELRRGEVLSWADECIECLQSLYLISILNDPALDQAQTDNIRIKIIFNTSTLIERGRIFFKNEVVDDFGSEKLPAYRGYRPRILDHLVVAHQIALFWPNGNVDEIQRRSAVAEDCLKNFVSLVQKEVGRDRSASVEALKGGQGVHLPSLLAAVKSERI